jgi:hypothetical protein
MRSLVILQYREALALLDGLLERDERPGRAGREEFSRQWYHPGLWDYLRVVLSGTLRC